MKDDQTMLANGFEEAIIGLDTSGEVFRVVYDIDAIISILMERDEMTEEDVAAQIKTPAVLQAFELAKLSTLPDDVRAAYEAEVREHDRYAQHTAELMLMTKIEVARKLLAMNLTVDQIEKATGLSSEDIKGLKVNGN